jgi:hypothetical protein
MSRRLVPSTSHARSGRRSFLKGGAALGVAGSVPLSQVGCSSGDDGLAPETAPRRESRSLHFDLSHGSIKDPVLHLPNSPHHRAALKAHDHDSRRRHRADNAMLADIEDDQLTHYLEEVDFPADALQVGTVMGVHPQTGAPMLGGHFLHVPEASLAKVSLRRAERGLPSRGESAKLKAYGVRDAALAATPIEADISFNSMPWEVAVWMIFTYPGVTNINADLGAEILDRIQSLPCGANDSSCLPQLAELASRIALMIGSGNFPTTSPTGSWATLVPVTDLDTGLPALDEDGAPLFSYEIDPSLRPLLARVADQILRNINSDPLFEGSNWQSRVESGRPASLQAAAGTYTLASDWKVGQRKSGIRVYGFDATDSRTVNISLSNIFLRTVGAFVQYFDGDGNALPVEGKVDGEDTDRSKRLTFIAPATTIMGMPMVESTQPRTELSFTLPPAAASAHVLFGSLGRGGAVNVPEAAAATAMTVIFNLAIPAIFLAYGIGSEFRKGFKEGLEDLLKDKVIAKTILADVLRYAPTEGTFATIETGSPGPALLQSLGTLLSIFLSRSPRMAALLATALASEAAKRAVPILGQILWAITVAMELAELTEALVECCAARSLETMTVSLTMETRVRISRDPRDFQFPASARRLEVRAFYDDAKEGTLVTVPLTQGQVDPVDALFENVPSGGKVHFVVHAFADDGELVGVGMSPQVDNMAETASLVPVELQEIARPLYPDSPYQHSLKLAWRNGALAWVAAAAPTVTAAAACGDSDGGLCALNGLTVNTALGMAGYAYRAGGQGMRLCNQNVADAMYVVQNVFLGANPESGSKLSPCGLTAPPGLVYDSAGPAMGNSNFMLQPPQGTSKFAQLRSVDLSPSAPFDFFQSTTWGRFDGSYDSLAVVGGRVVAVNRSTHKIAVLVLPRGPSRDDSTDVAKAAPFAALRGGLGSTVGLLDTPVAVASDGKTLYVLEQGNQRVQAFDMEAEQAKPVFGQEGTQKSAILDLLQKNEAKRVFLDLAVEATGYIYVLSYREQDHVGQVSADDYRVDLYSPTGELVSSTPRVAAGALAVDLFRNLYTLNYEQLSGASRIQPTLSQWLPGGKV